MLPSYQPDKFAIGARREHRLTRLFGSFCTLLYVLGLRGFFVLAVHIAIVDLVEVEALITLAGVVAVETETAGCCCCSCCCCCCGGGGGSCDGGCLLRHFLLLCPF
jgi:hypothetical protein